MAKTKKGVAMKDLTQDCGNSSVASLDEVSRLYEILLQQLAGDDLAERGLVMNWLPTAKAFKRDNGHITLVVPNAFTTKIITDRYLHTIQRVFGVREVIMRENEQDYQGLVDQGKEVQVIQPRPQQPQFSPDFIRAKKRVAPSVPDMKSLDDLVVHRGNEVAIKAMRKLVENVLRGRYNSERICLVGPPGVGKTAIVCAAVNELLNKLLSGILPGYVHLELVSKGFQEVHGTKNPDCLTAVLERRCCLLAVDHLGGLVKDEDTTPYSNRPGTQKSFMALWEVAGRRPVICTYTGNMAGLYKLAGQIGNDDTEGSKDNPLKSRLLGMKLIPVGVPTEERARFITGMIEKTGKAPGEEELAQIVSYLDDIIPQGAAIREIAGFFRGTLELSAGIAPISLQLVQNCFGQRDLFPADVAEAQASAERILGIADKLFPGISLSKLISPSREREVFRVRMRLMWLIKKLVPGITDYEIGMHFGGREHSTVNVALKQAKSLSEGEQQRLLAEASKMLGLRNA